MTVKRKSSSRTSAKPVEAPEIDAAWIAGADLYDGTKLIRRGRPKLANPRKLLSLRLPPEIIARWKASGPGWQTRMAEVLERSIPRRRRSDG
ncbi:MAG: BrnA antitoxin family protein [Pseudomonadota bacterium]